MPVHDYRSTSVTFDDHIPSVLQPYTAIEKQAEHLAITPQAEITNVHYVPGIGWRLQEYHARGWKTYELTSAQSGVLSASNWTKQADIEEFDSYRQSGFLGVSYAGGVQSSGSPVIQKRVGAGDSFAVKNTADQSAYPSPNTSEDPTDMDRWLTLNSNHEPSDAIAVSFYVPANALTTFGPLITFYFCGPAGSNASVGNGQYALKFYGDGKAVLYENGSAWVRRHEFSYCLGAEAVYGHVHKVLIYNNCTDVIGYPGNTITFLPSNFPLPEANGSFLIQSLAAQASDNIRLAAPRQYGLIYDVPRVTEEAVTIAPLRIDVRRDVRAILQVNKAKYPASGTLYDDVITLPFYPDTSEDLYVEVSGYIPSGSTLDVDLYDADTGTILGGEASYYSYEKGVAVSFTPNSKQRRYRVKITFTSTGDTTPTVTNVRLFRNSVLEDPGLTPEVIPLAPTNLQRAFPSDIKITGPRMEPTQEQAQITVQDLTGELTTISGKSGVPVKVETVYNSGGDKAVLFQGYCQQATGFWRKGGTGYGSGYSEYQLECVGEWARLQEALVPQRFSWYEIQEGREFKVTDIIRILLGTAYPSSYISIPDLDVRLLTTDQNAYVTEPGQSIGDVATKLAQDYLGAYLVFDPAAGGKWRLLEQKSAPYNYLVRFDTEHPGAGKLAHYEPSYGTSTNGSQTVQHTFIKRGTLYKWIERPEGNAVITVGSAGGDSNKSGGGAARVSQVAVNVDSYNFLNLSSAAAGYPDGTSIDYIGRFVPIFYVDSTLTNQDAVDWVTRRVFDMACHARTYLKFRAPLTLVTDANDSEQTQPRPLRFYDSVQVYEDGGWVDYLVVSCDPVYRKDVLQEADYLLVRPSNLNTKAVLPRGMSPKDTMDQLTRKATGNSANPNVQVAGNKSGLSGYSGTMVLPEATGDPIQDLDNTSGTFGDFYFMPDYDPIP